MAGVTSRVSCRALLASVSCARCQCFSHRILHTPASLSRVARIRSESCERRITRPRQASCIWRFAHWSQAPSSILCLASRTPRGSVCLLRLTHPRLSSRALPGGALRAAFRTPSDRVSQAASQVLPDSVPCTGSRASWRRLALPCAVCRARPRVATSGTLVRRIGPGQRSARP